VESRTLATGRPGHSMRMLSLPDAGRDLLTDCERATTPRLDGVAPRVHAGFGKRSDLIHNASLYRMYQIEAAAIEARGGRIRSIVLEDDRKRAAYARAPQWGPPTSEEARHAALVRAAEALNVPIVDGHLEFPDVRVEYDGPDGHAGRVDLELVTEQYRGGSLAAKAAAGFTMYSARGSSVRGIHALGGSPGGGGAEHWYRRSLLSL
jgi:hypothetical protein